MNRPKSANKKLMSAMNMQRYIANVVIQCMSYQVEVSHIVHIVEEKLKIKRKEDLYMSY